MQLNRKNFIKTLVLLPFAGNAIHVLANGLAGAQSLNKPKYVLHKANTRGKADYGWLQANYSFSFADYQDKDRMNFGKLRVLNDDIIAAGKGFGTHSHDNMEIITIPLEGALAHKDNTGGNGVIKAGDVQVMSAGTGIRHSEYNHHKDMATKSLQIWIFPNKENVTPRYDQKSLKLEDRKNMLQELVSPYPGNNNSLWIYQNAWLHIGHFDKGSKTNYQLKAKENGVYAFVLKGDVIIDDKKLNQRDALGIWNTTSINIEAEADMELLLIEVPME